MAGSSELSFDVFHNIIDGKPRGSSKVHRGVDPTTGKPLWNAPVATVEDINDAVDASRKAFPAWSSLEYSARVRLLDQFADAFLELAPQFTALLQAETGRTEGIAQVEVHWSPLWLRYPGSHTLPHQVFEDDDKVVTVHYDARGVVAAICPWNYPIMLSFGKIAPALAVGNCVIIKPSPFTPYTALKFIELAQSIFPPGVLQVVADDGTLGPHLVNHPGIQQISFTGSTATGKKVMEAAAKTMKKVTLELGGNDSSIIMPDVEIDKIIPEVAMGAWWNSGQSCIATKRLYIHKDIYDDFLKALVEFTKSISVGCGSGGGPVMGPVQNEMQFVKLKGLIEECREHGYIFALDEPEGGRNDLARQSLDSGFFLWPMIVDDPPAESSLVMEEQFGPIIPCVPFSNEDSVIAAVNGTPTGLSASVWCGSVHTAQRIASQLDVGTVFINGPSRPDPRVPFSGHKESGMGVEYGLMGLVEYCQVKSIVRYK
ncbi:hypothetical protein N7471_008999 [Penicillium samsonianum]|uniref:uncharacterized protein n=1 Tax=Penicillium samsonianum TaxID=1882272 RepID=UPI002547D5A0|nr:uncharacterized protein N7471_008999 [Penicillium samsonianum]KAJ6127782.1 hypothetical protein N7471_008999 [Penicillium samsonianum]